VPNILRIFVIALKISPKLKLFWSFLGFSIKPYQQFMLISLVHQFVNMYVCLSTKNTLNEFYSL